MNNINIWDSVNEQWLKPMAIFFNNKGEIYRVDGIIKGDDSLKDGWYKIEGDDLDKVAIIGDIKYNTDLIPN